jgi:sortase (surface protein transpeptidase)
VPPSVDQVGWYRFGPGISATAGSVVIAGHVDAAEQGAGAFFKLRDLKPGDPVEVTRPDGTVVRFTVAAREIYEKKAIPLDKYFARDGALRLTLITCGGPFDKATGHYRDNVVITAAPTA